MKISKTLIIILCGVLLISCGAKDEASKPSEAKTKETQAAPPPIADPAAPAQNDILQAQMNALNKAKKLEKEMMEAKTERDRQDKETLGM